jgi:aspartyl-tRNA(Asn)/glutamyl-tRNA(Gln) amidotransferase subunit B
LTDTKAIALYFDALCQETKNYKSAANWIMGPVKSYLNDKNLGINDFPIPPRLLAGLIQLVDEGKVSNTVANQQIFVKMLNSKGADAETIANKENLLQESSSDSIQPIIDEVLDDMADKVKEYKSGRTGLIGLFVGEVMKRSKGKADPKKTNELLHQTLK